MDMIYESFVSLGGQCATASSLARYGLRDFSGPFDWCVSDFEGIIQNLEDDFCDFLNSENLISDSINKTVFRDVKYGFMFNHDLANGTLEEELSQIKEKYARRINKLREIVSRNPVCFVRLIRNSKEIDFILRESARIKEAITKWNVNSLVIFVALKNHDIPKDFPFMVYQADIYSYHNHFKIGLRSAFETIPEFVEFCSIHYDCDKQKRNLIFESRKKYDVMISRDEIEKKAIQEIHLVEKRMFENNERFKVLIKIQICEKEKLLIPKEGIDIYGAGILGKVFCDKLGGENVIGCFVDRKAKEIRDYNGIPVYNPDDYRPEKGRVLVITTVHSHEEIISDLRNRCGQTEIMYVTLDAFLSPGIFEKRFNEIMR